MGVSIKQVSNYFKIDTDQLPYAIKVKIDDKNISKITFEQPAPENVTFVSRNHPLTTALAEYIFNSAFKSKGNAIASRCGVIRSKEVDVLTTLLLLRIRYLINDKKHSNTSFAEECIVTGFKGVCDSAEWLPENEAEYIFYNVTPSSNLSDSEKKYWAGLILDNINSIEEKLNQLAKERAEVLYQSYERVRKTIKGTRVLVEPMLPVDILSVSVIIPQPK